MTTPLLVNTQFALFFAQPLQKPEELWDDIRNSPLASTFDQTPRIQPVPNDPNLMEVPILQLQSEKGHTIHVSRMRADYTYLHPHGSAESDEEATPWFDDFQTFYSFFDEQLVIRRLGYVKRYFFESQNPAVDIAELLRFDPASVQGGAVHEAGIRYVTRDRFEKFIINNFTSIEQASATGSDGQVLQGFLVTRDVNTAPEENYLFDSDTLAQYFIEAEERLVNGVTNLFANGGPKL